VRRRPPTPRRSLAGADLAAGGDQARTQIVEELVEGDAADAVTVHRFSTEY
jgi:hypothetical protein